MAVADDKVRIQITLSREIAERLEESAKRAGISKSALASIALTEYILSKGLDKQID